MRRYLFLCPCCINSGECLKMTVWESQYILSRGCRNFLIEVTIKTKPEWLQYNISCSVHLVLNVAYPASLTAGFLWAKGSRGSLLPFCDHFSLVPLAELKCHWESDTDMTNEVTLFIEWERTMVEFIRMPNALFGGSGRKENNLLRNLSCIMVTL